MYFSNSCAAASGIFREVLGPLFCLKKKLFEQKWPILNQKYPNGAYRASNLKPERQIALTSKLKTTG